MVLVIIRASLAVTVFRRVQPLWWWAVMCITTTVMGAVIFLNMAALVGLKRSVTTPAHYPLASLATADLLVGLFVMPLAVFRELYIFDLNWEVCAIWKTLDVLCCTASILSLCVLGWERWSGITDPLARASRAKTAKWLALGVWPVALAVALPTGFMWSPRIDINCDSRVCPENVNVGYVFFSTALSFYLPVAVMLWFYAKIVWSLRHQPQIRSHAGAADTTKPTKTSALFEKSISFYTRQNKTPQGPSKQDVAMRTDIVAPGNAEYQTPKSACVHPVMEQPKKHDEKRMPVKVTKKQRRIEQRHRRATRAIVRLMSLFLICWTPFFVLLPIDSLCECLNDSLWETATWLGYTNSALNPLVYAVSIWSSIRALQSKVTGKTETSDCAKKTGGNNKKENKAKKQDDGKNDEKKPPGSKNTGSNEKSPIGYGKLSVINEKMITTKDKATSYNNNVAPDGQTPDDYAKMQASKEQPSTSNDIGIYIDEDPTVTARRNRLTINEKKILEIFQWIVADVEDSKVNKIISENYGITAKPRMNATGLVRRTSIVSLTDKPIPPNMFNDDEVEDDHLELRSRLNVDILPSCVKNSFNKGAIKKAKN